jgi:hypothetical protein
MNFSSKNSRIEKLMVSSESAPQELSNDHVGMFQQF